MKQRVVVQAIIRSNDNVLLLRRSQGRPGIIGKYELPGGTLDDNEQPDDGIRRHLRNNLGFDVHSVRVLDALSMTNRDEGDIQHVFIVYSVDGISQATSIQPGRSYDKSIWIKLSEIQQAELRESAFYLLGLDSSLPTHDNVAPIRLTNSAKNTTAEHILIYSDGGSRGNPGPSAAGFVMLNNDNVIDQGGEYIGITTNNQAEYHGVRLGLERALERGIKTLEFRIDSMLVVNQLNGLYKIKNRELWPINERIQSLVAQFNNVKFHHVPRELNKMADALVNKLLDEHESDLS